MTSRLNHNSALEVVPVTIANGASLSEAVDLGGLRLFGVDMPSSWTTANLTIQSLGSDGMWRDLKDDNGSEIVITASASAAIRLRDPTLFAAINALRVRSGTSASPVAQGADRSLSLILRSI